MKVLVIDDEPQILRALKVGLERDHFEAVLASSGEEGLSLAAEQKPDFIILDLAMPGIDGFEVCKQLRAWTATPVVVLSVRDSPEEKIQALDAGADDYITKPFSVGELMARMRAVMRRISENGESELTVLTFSDLVIDLGRRRVTLAGNELHLTPIEYELLCYMAKNSDRVLTHGQILTKVWGTAYAEDHHTLRVHVANLRNKIEQRPERPRFIHTETRIGYTFRSRST